MFEREFPADREEHDVALLSLVNIKELDSNLTKLGGYLVSRGTGGTEDTEIGYGETTVLETADCWKSRR